MSSLTVHVYTRVSKTYQQEGSGIDEQLSRINTYIESKPELKNCEITYWQDIGLSAYRNKNILDGELAEFLKRVESGEICEGHHLVIYSLDRLSRRSSWDEDTIQKVVKSGVIIHDVSTPVVLRKDDQFSKIIMELIISRGNNESKIKSERSIAGWEKRLRETTEQGKVFTKKLPRWLTTDDNGYVVIPEQALIIKRIFSEYTNGLTSPMIARRLNEEGIKSTGTSLWRPNTVTKLIKDERLRGNLRRNGDKSLIANIFPVIIDNELFEIANRILEVNAAGTKGRPRENNVNREVHNILTGMIRCGKCGSRVTTSKNMRDVRYVVCRNRLNFRICGQGSKRLDLLEKVIINHIKKIDMNKVFSYQEVDTSIDATLKSELLTLEIEAESCKVKINERKKAKKTLSFSLAETLTDIEDRIVEIHKQLQGLNLTDPLVSIEDFDLEMLMDYNNVELRMSLRKFLTQVIEKISFQSIEKYNLIEIKYNQDVYRHVLITNEKLTQVEHEITIQKIAETIDYRTASFSITENMVYETCTFSDVLKANLKDYFLLANYLSGMEGKQWIVDLMYENNNMSLVTSNT
ncbi:recombinase family protein [Pantoea sp. JK]|uniref:recombinase family protein n=1 Tax=Pantoea sp. JK TaxID=2871703 RepID=UPI0022371B96|nr:recombinase family protein [Pantoea sp. JK]MCW6030147.1 recombinase family protein [Pantoea sp. JK]